jgi:hypothetical protein
MSITVCSMPSYSKIAVFELEDAQKRAFPHKRKILFQRRDALRGDRPAKR